jgi:hypothetical protein
MYGSFWLVLFSMFVFANMMGLNISSAFNSAVTIYIMIPLLMIPQMALGGSMFSFEKLNQIIGSIGKVPIIAELMPSRWSYEALMVKQYRDNKFNLQFYELEKIKSQSNFMSAHYVEELQKARKDATNCLDTIAEALDDPEIDTTNTRAWEEFNLVLLREEIAEQMKRLPEFKCKNYDKLNVAEFDEKVSDDVDNYLESLRIYFRDIYNRADKENESRKQYYESQSPGYYNRRRDLYQNDKLEEIVVRMKTNIIIRHNNRLIQQNEPIYHDADNYGFFGFRAHFYAPRKWFCGRYYDTFAFDTVVIWLFSLLCYIALYFDLLKKTVDWAGTLDFKAMMSNAKAALKPKPRPKEDDPAPAKAVELKVVPNTDAKEDDSTASAKENN